MKTFFFMAMLFALGATTASAQQARTRIQKVRDGLYFMYYDSTALKTNITKSTIVEFDEYVALLEMPISYGGGGTVHLQDYTEGGEQVWQSIHDYFPHKPLRYIFSSHWHPHSLSSIKPFISRGVTIVSTLSNFKRLREMLDSASYQQYKEYICLVDGDSLSLRDEENSIVAYRFTKKDYPNVPTEDYLYFYLPRYNFLHCSCMYQRLKGSNVCGKELISGRTEDLQRFTEAKHLRPEYFISGDTYFDEDNGMASQDTVQMMFRIGMRTSELVAILSSMSEGDLRLKSDSLKKYILNNRIAPTYINSTVYILLRKKELSHALALAQMLTQLNPSDPNSWDTYGEVYYFMGETQLAKFYETQSKRINKDFKGGGEETWKKDLEEYQRLWNAN